VGRIRRRADRALSQPFLQLWSGSSSWSAHLPTAASSAPSIDGGSPRAISFGCAPIIKLLEELTVRLSVRSRCSSGEGSGGGPQSLGMVVLSAPKLTAPSACPPSPCPQDEVSSWPLDALPRQMDCNASPLLQADRRTIRLCKIEIDMTVCCEGLHHELRTLGIRARSVTVSNNIRLPHIN
jgi:hypothetical protein